MNFIETLASEIRAELPIEVLPDDDTDQLFLFYAVLLLAKETSVTPEDVHNAWAAWMSGRDEGHPSVVPFSELDEATKAEDLPFVDAIRRVAERRPEDTR
ncbi:MAG TPA: hypothetical protein VFF40_14250 [Acidimicrobiia bacterium]|nr:hypothetical protein [Acidimicrobiia bacterium]